MTYLNNDALKSIRKRLANYEMRVLHTNGVYRHLRFHSPTDPFPGNCSFEVVTWPGHAWIGGDWCGGHTIAREPDMLTQFLNVTRIDYGYWAEKMRATSSATVTQETDAAVEDWITDQVSELSREHTLTAMDKKLIHRIYRGVFNEDEYSAGYIEAIKNLESVSCYDSEAGEEIELAVSDAWELEFTEYTHEFLVACEGLRFAAEKWAERIEGAVE